MITRLTKVRGMMGFMKHLKLSKLSKSQFAILHPHRKSGHLIIRGEDDVVMAIALSVLQLGRGGSSRGLHRSGPSLHPEHGDEEENGAWK